MQDDLAGGGCLKGTMVDHESKIDGSKRPWHSPAAHTTP
jgi:hypothetical protein